MEVIEKGKPSVIAPVIDPSLILGHLQSKKINENDLLDKFCLFKRKMPNEMSLDCINESFLVPMNETIEHSRVLEPCEEEKKHFDDSA